MAKHIRAGGLKDDPENSQVLPPSFAPLAAMNDAGLLTVDSQDAPDATQRAYVDGLMPSKRAEALVDWLNLNTDMVAIVPVEHEVPRRLSHIQPPHPQGMGVALTRHLFPGKIWRRTTHVRTHMVLGPGSNENMQVEEAGLSEPDPDLVSVTCFDPKWGRSATSSDGLFGHVIRALVASATADTPGLVHTVMQPVISGRGSERASRARALRPEQKLDQNMHPKSLVHI